MPKVKKVPRRVCVGCREMKPKRELIRVVRTPEESIEIDHTGKRSGRGAYICASMECLEEAIKGKRLERALKQTIAPEIRRELAERLERP
ncbi:MAG: YlxR family protein [Firmicutes bacterium]|nr:YlxR family protein [Bacillota bacterium]